MPRKSLFAICFVLVLAGCQPRSSSTVSLDGIADEYIRLALELGERDFDSVDYVLAPEPLRAALHRESPTLAEIGRRSDQLLAELPPQSCPQQQAARCSFLKLQLQAIQARVAILQGRALPFDAEARLLFDTEVLPDSEERVRAGIREQIQTLLPATHSRTTGENLVARLAKYQRQFVVPPRQLPAVMHAALASCRAQTLRYVSLPADEAVKLDFVHHRPWSGFSQYEGAGRSKVLINLDFPIGMDDALELACHEGYPGHHVFNTLHEFSLAAQRLPEREVQLTFSPQSYVSEAMAAYAPELAFPPQERVVVERDILFPLLGLPAREADRYVRICDLLRRLQGAQPAIAREYLDGRLEFVRAEEALAGETLAAHNEDSLLYLNEFRSYILSYTDGPRGVRAYLCAGSDECRRSGAEEENRKLLWQRFTGLAQAPWVRLPHAE